MYCRLLKWDSFCLHFWWISLQDHHNNIHQTSIQKRKKIAALSRICADRYKDSFATITHLQIIKPLAGKSAKGIEN